MMLYETVRYSISRKVYLLLITSNVGSSKLLLQANLHTVVLSVPLPEGGGINLDDCVLYKCLGSDQLVVG